MSIKDRQQRSSLSRENFEALMILYSEIGGACVDIVFRRESGWSGRADRQSRNCCVKPIRKVLIADDANDRMTGG